MKEFRVKALTNKVNIKTKEFSNAYLNRIGYRGPLTPTAETLHALHQAHVLAVPFENLYIHLGQPILLDEAHLFDKIVTQQRGDFCLELNGLFDALLQPPILVFAGGIIQ